MKSFDTKKNRIVMRLSLAEHALIKKASEKSGISVGELVRLAANKRKRKELPDIPYKNEKSTMVLLTDAEKGKFSADAAERGLSLEAYLRLATDQKALEVVCMAETDLLNQIGDKKKRKSPEKTPALLAAQQASKVRFAQMRKLGCSPSRSAEQTEKVLAWLNSHSGQVITTKMVATETCVSIHLVRDVFASMKKDGKIKSAGFNSWKYWPDATHQSKSN